MSTEESTRNQETEAYPSADTEIKEFYRANVGKVDVHGFVSRLGERLDADKKHARQRSHLRRVGLAVAGLVVAGGLGIGVWQGAEYLAGPEETLLIGDSGPALDDYDETTSTVTEVASSNRTSLDSTGLPTTFESSEPRSVTKLELAKIWAKAAAALGFNANTARLESIQVSWDGDGLLAGFDVGALTPDSRSVYLSAGLDNGAAPTDFIIFTGYADPVLGSGETPWSWSGAPDSVSVSVAQVLACLDNANLMEIGAQSGLQVQGDPAELWRDSAGYAMDPTVAAEVFGPKGVPDTVTWVLHNYSARTSFLTAEDLGIYLDPTSHPVILHVSPGQVSRVDDSYVDPSCFPATLLSLGRTWSATYESGGGGVASGGPRAYVLLGPLETDQASSVASHAVDAQLDGLAFTAPLDGTLYLVEDGQAQTIWQPDREYARGSGSYGVSYSLGSTMLLWGAAISTVTVEGSDSSFEVYRGQAETGAGGQTSEIDESAPWRATFKGDAAVFELSPTEGSKPMELLRTKLLPMMNRFEYDETNDRVWIAKSSGTAETAIQTAQPHTAEFDWILRGAGGDFAVSPDGSTIVYVGPWQVPAKVMLRTPDAETDLALGLAIAYNPSFSPDGGRVCVVGSRDANGDTALWMLDADGGNCTEIAATRGLTPTYPVFSPDGRRIAFRNWQLGDIWTVDIESGELTRYVIDAADAPFAW